jgi:hypothetical protein
VTHLRTFLPLLVLALGITRIIAGITPAWTSGEHGLGNGRSLRRGEASQVSVPIADDHLVVLA